MSLPAERPDRPLRIALVGAGAAVASQHVEAMEHLDAAVLVAVSDADPRARERLASTVSVPCYADHRDLLAEVDVDVGVIVTPHPSHAAIALDLFAAGCHVLVEKPIAVEVLQADRMIGAARDAGRTLAVALQDRFAPLTRRAKALMAEGAVGPLVRVHCSEPWLRTAAYFRASTWRATWRGEGGGVLLNQAPHTLDLLCHLAGPPTRVWGVARTRRHAIECEDTAHALLEFGNGATGYVAVSTAEAGGTRRLEIVGERGRLDLEGDRLTLTRFDPPVDQHVDACPEPFAAPALHVTPTETLSRHGTHGDVYEDLIEALRTGRAPRADGSEARMSLELANAITLSSHREAPVDLPLDRDAYAELLATLRARAGGHDQDAPASRNPAR